MASSVAVLREFGSCVFLSAQVENMIGRVVGVPSYSDPLLKGTRAQLL